MAIQDYISLIDTNVAFLDKSVFPHSNVTGLFQGISLMSKDIKDIEFYVDNVTYKFSQVDFSSLDSLISCQTEHK